MSAESTIDAEVVQRLRRLTPRERRVVMLVAARRGVTYADLADILGTSRGNVASTMQRIRRKLAVPSHHDLHGFLTAWSASSPDVIDDGAADPRGRRQQLQLRATIDDLRAVALRARGRADDLERSTVPDPLRIEEMWTIRRVAELVDAAVEQSLAVARRPAPADDRADVS